MRIQEPAAKSMWGIILPFCKIVNLMDSYWNENKCVRSFKMELFHVMILSNSNKFYNQCIALLLV